ncbi:MAG: hypothetical protein MUC67_01265 [Acidobacteria bacterium]|jgi:hypothetical protein|nr:hypothetical protein [Acidobacteriota bacterium]
MKTTPGAIGLLIAATLLIAVVPAARATSISAHIDGLFVVGDQLYDGGEVIVRSVGSGLIAVLINGRQVALLHRQDFGARPPHSKPYLEFRVDDQGLPHLAAVRFRSERGQSTALISLQVASTSPGLLTLPYRLPYSEPILRASR